MTLQHNQELGEWQTLKLQVRTAADNHVVQPVKRRILPDLVTPRFKDLLHLGLLRVIHAAFPTTEQPPRLFATSETVFGRYFTRDDWLKYGDLETEMGRMRYMLSELPERGIPTICLGLLCSILSSRWVLDAWKETVDQLHTLAESEIDWMLHEMLRQQVKTYAFQSGKSRYLTIPVDYRTDRSARHIALLLWKRSLSEMVSHAAQSRFDRAGEFLQIFAFLKDPLGGQANVVAGAEAIFVYIMKSLTDAHLRLSNIQWHNATAQAAQEAVYLATPLLQDVVYVHFHAHQQLPYAYVEIDRLSRSEFSIPHHVLHIIEEILNDDAREADGMCRIAPIAVASYPALPPQRDKMQTIVLDGNHRVTAVMVLRLIAERRPSLRSTRPSKEVLDSFCSAHGLSMKWKLDLTDVFEALPGTPCEELILNKPNLVQRFREVDTIPSLIVREDHFHTACQQRPSLRDRPHLLLPIHQALFNDQSTHFAFPQAGQVHGRATGYKAMPLVF